MLESCLKRDIAKKVILYLQGHGFGTVEEVFLGIQSGKQPVAHDDFIDALHSLYESNLLNVHLIHADTKSVIICLNMLNADIDALIAHATCVV